MVVVRKSPIKTDVMMIVAQGAMAISLIINTPINFMPFRSAILSLIYSEKSYTPLR
jgi:hypothetical protein